MVVLAVLPLVCVVLYLIPVGIVWERLKPRPILLPPPIDYHKRICGFSGCRPCYDHTYADKNCAVCWENDFTRCTVEFAVLSECLKQYRSDNDQHVDTRVAMAIFWFVMLPIWVGQFLGKPKKKVVTDRSMLTVWPHWKSWSCKVVRHLSPTQQKRATNYVPM